MKLILMLGLAIFLVGAPQIASANCFDVSKKEPAVLVGKLQFIIFPGPPNFEDVKNGDEPEGAYILKLGNEICIEGDEFADATKMFNVVHLVPGDGLRKDFRRLVGKSIKVNLYDQYGSHTGHHHAPLVAWVKQIKLLSRR